MSRRREPGPPPDDYEVGYGRPPAATRFQPGRSGNPSGRRKGLPTLAESLDRELAKTVVVRDGGKDRRITMWNALVRSLVHDAVRGIPSARKQLLALLERAPPGSQATLEDMELPPEDRAILMAYVERAASASPPSEPATPPAASGEGSPGEDDQEQDEK